MAEVDSGRPSAGRSHDLAVAHALRVVSAMNRQDHHAFIQMYPATPNDGVYLMDYFLHELRQSRYERLIRAYLPSVPVDYVIVSGEMGCDG